MMNTKTRIALVATALLPFLPAGCGGAARPEPAERFGRLVLRVDGIG